MVSFRGCFCLLILWGSMSLQPSSPWLLATAEGDEQKKAALRHRAIIKLEQDIKNKETGEVTASLEGKKSNDKIKLNPFFPYSVPINTIFQVCAALPLDGASFLTSGVGWLVTGWPHRSDLSSGAVAGRRCADHGAVTARTRENPVSG